MTKIEIIDETVAFYSDTSKRSTITHGNVAEGSSYSQCVYNGPDGKHCAFARCVENPNDLTEGYQIIDTAAGIDMMEIARFKPGYEGHNVNFWLDIQNLHDTRQFWSTNGLTQAGEAEVRQLKQKHS